MSEEIFREVDDDLRQDQYFKLWKQYGRFLIGAAVGVVVATAVWQGYAAWERGRNESYSERFIAALQMLQSGQPGAAITTLETLDRKSTRLNSSHSQQSRMPSSA